jgi:hypothetical protein
MPSAAILTYSIRGVILEIDIWRVANLMLKRYGEKTVEECSARAADGDHDGAST